MPSALRSYFHRVRGRVKSLWQGRRGTVYEIFHNSAALKVSWLTLENESGESEVGWDDVVSVHAFKKDCMAVDLICLEIGLRDETALIVTEDMKGWDGLVEQLPAYLPGCKPFAEWFEAAAFPAFETNLTLLYQRGGAPRPQ